MRSPNSKWTVLSEALDLYEDFHILEALPQRWSPYHMFKCNCPCCFKNASCAHVLLASMLCDKQIEVPMQYVDAALQFRRRGRRARAPDCER